MSKAPANKSSPVVTSAVVKQGDEALTSDELTANDTGNTTKQQPVASDFDADSADSFAGLKQEVLAGTESNEANTPKQIQETSKEQAAKQKIAKDLKQENAQSELPLEDSIADASDKTNLSDKTDKNLVKSEPPETSEKDSNNSNNQTVAINPTSKKQSTKTEDNMSQPRKVAILGGNRIPFARSNGTYANASNIDMLSAALNGLVERYDLQGERMGEVVAGAVLKLSRDLNLTRESALNTALDPHTPAYDISQACGTGLQAAFAVSNKIALGIIDSGIAGGVDTTSDAPIAVGDGLRKALIKLGAARNNKDRFAALKSINPKDLIDAPQNGEPRTGLSMGEHQAITALEWNISREAQDELAAKSHQNLARAYDEGFLDDLITPYKGLTRDNNLRPDSTTEKLAKLKPVFGKRNANPTMTAANSTPLTDGASCVLMGTEAWAEAHGLKPLYYIVNQETAAVAFIGKDGPKEGLLMAPAYAVPRMLERAGLTLQDFDFYEIHEAFASQVLSTLAAWEDETFCKERLGLDKPLGKIDMTKLNVNGSSLAAGHPFAATGGRILATAAKLLDQKGSGRALISICAAGGQGVTCILEK